MIDHFFHNCFTKGIKHHLLIQPGPILESKGMHLIFQKKDKKSKNMLKR